MPQPITTLMPVPLVPEISLHLVAGTVGLFDLSGGEYRSDEPPPFWAFVWAGGQALARYLLDHPEKVAGKRVHDLATGSGIVAIAAAKAGATEVAATDLDPASVAAAHRNARANGVALSNTSEKSKLSAKGADGEKSLKMDVPDVLLAGDVYYSPAVAPQMTAAFRAARREGAEVLVGDPGRGHFPERLFERVAEYVVPVPPALEEAETLVTGVWRLR
nr:50S ribosomal protein L11 methyltransferase [uncultured Actinoplanes sp.]